MSFNQHEVMMKHKQIHEGKKLFQCANCHQSFRYKVSLKSHVINYHSYNNQTIISNQLMGVQTAQSLQYMDCGKQFATKYKLQRHARCHTGEKPYRCNFCDRSFSQTGNLKLHQMPPCSMPAEAREPQQKLQQQHTINSPPVDCNVANAMNTFQPVYLTESQDTINETINSTTPSSSYLNKPYDNQLYIDDEIETMLDQVLNQLEQQKYAASTFNA